MNTEQHKFGQENGKPRGVLGLVARAMRLESSPSPATHDHVDEHVSALGVGGAGFHPSHIGEEVNDGGL